MSALALVIALIGGKLALSALTVADYVTLTQAGISVARLVVILGQKLDQRFPCDAACQKIAEAGRKHAMYHPYLTNGAWVGGLSYQEPLAGADGSKSHGRRHKLAP